MTIFSLIYEKEVKKTSDKKIIKAEEFPAQQYQKDIENLRKNLKNAPEVLISRNEYVISYNRSTRMLNWAAWKLEAADIGHVGRSNNFIPDQNFFISFKKRN